MGKWSNLPLDLLYVIEEYVTLYIDKARLRAVSLDWNSHLPKLPDHRANQIHFLLSPLKNNENNEDSEEEATHGLFNPIDKKTYKLYLPELTGKMFKGSLYGWIIATEHMDTSLNNIYLINPVTRALIKLPERYKFLDGATFVTDEVGGESIARMIPSIISDYEFVRDTDEFSLNKYHMKIVLSSDPSNDECVVIATFRDGDIVWCKCDGQQWSYAAATTEFTDFIDILYSKGYLYAITNQGRVFMLENIGTELEIKSKEITTDVPIPVENCAYLAECSDGSLIVVVPDFFIYTDQEERCICTTEFKVYKFFSNPNLSWVEVKSIGDDVLFVGFGSVTLIPSTQLAGYKKNHIYFCNFAKPVATDKGHWNSKCNKDVKSYVGVFSLEDGTVKPLQGLGDPIWPRPIWTNIDLFGRESMVRITGGL